jgi:hypothetical protein
VLKPLAEVKAVIRVDRAHCRTRIKCRLVCEHTGGSAWPHVDVVVLGDPEALAERLEEALAEPYEGFAFRAGEPEALDFRPQVRRVDIQLSFAGKPFTTLRVEFAPAEAGGDEFDELPGHDLSQIGLKGPDTVPVLALRWQVAQKLHAVSEAPLREGGENARYWDLIDLQLLEALTTDRLVRIRVACVQMFEVREQHSWPPEITVYPSWPELYRTVATEMEMPITDVYEAAEAVRDFIDRIDQA